MVVESGMQNISCRQIQNSIASLLMSNDFFRQLQTLQQQRMDRFTQNAKSQNKSQIQTNMSRIAIAVTENANPNAESISVLKAKDVEHVVCTENLRSESSTPVKDNVEAQLVATSQPSGNCLIIKF